MGCGCPLRLYKASHSFAYGTTYYGLLVSKWEKRFVAGWVGVALEGYTKLPIVLLMETIYYRLLILKREKRFVALFRVSVISVIKGKRPILFCVSGCVHSIVLL